MVVIVAVDPTTKTVTVPAATPESLDGGGDERGQIVRVALAAGRDVMAARDDHRARILSSRRAGVAQLVEQSIRNRQVIGSSPIAGSRSNRSVPVG